MWTEIHRVDRGGAWSSQADPGHSIGRSAAAAFCPCWRFSRRPGQVVPRRGPAALGCVWPLQPQGEEASGVEAWLEQLCQRLGLDVGHARPCKNSDAWVLVMGFDQESGWQSCPWPHSPARLPVPNHFARGVDHLHAVQHQRHLGQMGVAFLEHVGSIFLTILQVGAPPGRAVLLDAARALQLLVCIFPDFTSMATSLSFNTRSTSRPLMVRQ